MAIKDVVIPKTDKGNDPNDNRHDSDYIRKIEEASKVRPIGISEGNSAASGKSSIEQLNDCYAVVNVAGKTLIVEQKRDPVTGYLHDEFLTTENASKYLKNRFATDNNGEAIYSRSGRKVSAFEIWMSSPERNTYSSICFKPAPYNNGTKSPKFPAGETYNQWKGLHIQPTKGDCSKIVAHLHEIWCAGRETRFDYTWNWLARMVKRPHERGETAIILRSGQGTGKNIIADIFVEFFGIHGMMVSSPEHLVGRFTGHQRLLVFLFANEAVWGGDKKIEGILKSFITDEYRTTEEKFLSAITERNYMHLLLATNSDWAAPMDLDDRRYLVLDVDERRKGDREYFEALKHEIDNGGKAALLHDLLETDISNFDHRVLPIDQGASKLIDQLKTADPIIRWWFEVLIEGQLYCQDSSSNEITVLHGSKDWAKKQMKIGKRELHDSYLLYCKTHNIRFIQDISVFMRSLYQHFNSSGGDTFSRVKEGRARKVCIATLCAARGLFQQAVGNQSIDWDQNP